MPTLVPIHACTVPADAATLRTVHDLEAIGRLSTDHAVVRAGRLQLELEPGAIAELRRLHVEVIVGDDVREVARRVQHITRSAARRRDDGGLLVGFVDGYLDAAGLHARFAALHAEFPALTSYTDLPAPTHGYDGSNAALAGPSRVKLFRITTTPGSLAKPGVLFVAGNHAREWVPPLSAIELAEQLLRNYAPGSAVPAIQRITALLDGLDWLIVPAMNPDGINYSHHDDPSWRKNRRPPPPGSQLARGAGGPAHPVRVAPAERVDALPAPVHEALALRRELILTTGVDPVAPRKLLAPPSSHPPVAGVSYNLRFQVRGATARTGPFVRLGMRSVYLS